MNNNNDIRIVGQNQISYNKYTNVFKNQQVLLHKHMFFEVNICLDGQFINRINNCDVLTSKGTCAILRPQDAHTFLPPPLKNEDYFHQDIYIPTDTMRRCCDFLSDTLFNDIINNPAPIHFNLSNTDFEFLVKRLNYLVHYFDYDASFIECVYLSCVAQLLSFYLINLNDKPKTAFPAWINSLLLKLDDLNFLTLPESAIAKEFGYTSSHFSREFKKYMKISFVKYLIIRKANVAADMLIKSDMQIIEISQTLGYSSLSPFNKNFKECFKCSPSQYRKNFTVK